MKTLLVSILLLFSCTRSVNYYSAPTSKARRKMIIRNVKHDIKRIDKFDASKSQQAKKYKRKPKYS